jgi:hypothetical protein
MARRIAWTLSCSAALLMASCEARDASTTGPGAEPPRPPTTAPSAEPTPEVVLAAGDFRLPDATPLPEGWSGLGVLARSEVPLPADAPEWARVAAEVVERDGQRYLLTTAFAPKMPNHALARTASENRARAALARWTGQERLQGSMLVAAYASPDGRQFARAELVLPSGYLAPSPAGAAAHD